MLETITIEAHGAAGATETSKRSAQWHRVPSVGTDSPVTIVLCHGFGADASDLAPLARELQLPLPARWVFPQAPHAFPAGWGNGRAWFPDDPERIARFATGEAFGELASLDPPGLASSGAAVADLVRETGGPLVLGGFSQGAMVACEAVIAAGVRPVALVLMSGALVARERWERLLAHAGDSPLAGLQVFQSHGTHDPILRPAGARDLGELLVGAGAERTVADFTGGHTIPAPILDRLVSFFQSVVAGGAP